MRVLCYFVCFWLLFLLWRENIKKKKEEETRERESGRKKDILYNIIPSCHNQILIKALRSLEFAGSWALFCYVRTVFPAFRLGLLRIPFFSWRMFFSMCVMMWPTKIVIYILCSLRLIFFSTRLSFPYCFYRYCNKFPSEKKLCRYRTCV